MPFLLPRTHLLFYLIVGFNETDRRCINHMIGSARVLLAHASTWNEGASFVYLISLQKVNYTHQLTLVTFNETCADANLRG